MSVVLYIVGMEGYLIQVSTFFYYAIKDCLIK